MPLEEHMAIYLNQGYSRKEAMKMTAKDRGVSKRDIYQQLLQEDESIAKAPEYQQLFFEHVESPIINNDAP